MAAQGRDYGGRDGGERGGDVAWGLVAVEAVSGGQDVCGLSVWHHFDGVDDGF